MFVASHYLPSPAMGRFLHQQKRRPLGSYLTAAI